MAKLKKGAYSTEVVVKKQIIQIVGINTAWLSKDEDDRHRLNPGVALLEDALKKHNHAALSVVLGHHPLDWMDDAQAQELETVLSKARAIYLHGHVHEGDARYVLGPSGFFLGIRSGAAFQGRTNDKPRWANGLVWAEADISEGVLKLQPQFWSPEHKEWKIQSDVFTNRNKMSGRDWWEFTLPASAELVNKKSSGKAQRKVIGVPEGWAIVDRKFLSDREGRAD